MTVAAARFYLGTHHSHWLERADFPLFISRRTLAGRKRLPRARHAWAEDSGGFTELSMHGAWSIKPSQRAAHREAHIAYMREWRRRNKARTLRSEETA